MRFHMPGRGSSLTMAAWLACTNPIELLHSRQGRSSARKLRLFACACCRRIWPLLEEGSGQQAVRTSERYADGCASRAELRAAQAVMRAEAEAWEQRVVEEMAALPRMHAAWAAWAAASTAWVREEAAAARAARLAAKRAASAVYATTQESNEGSAQCALVRDIFGSPLGPVPISEAWLHWQAGSIVQLARTIYDERRFGDLPLLADMLTDAGCDNVDILEHCRGGDHVRGCWVVDALLGKQ
jgi:hypothetical protein